MNKLYMATLKEGDLVFDFEGGTEVIKWDETKFYIYKFQNGCGCEGASAVDFVVIQGSNRYLIEVKDYASPGKPHDSDSSERWIEDLREFICKIARKYRDTLTGLLIASVIKPRVSGKKIKNELGNEKDFARKFFCPSPDAIYLVLHIEPPAKGKSILYSRDTVLADIHHYGKKIMKACGSEFIVTSMQIQIRQFPWKVSRASEAK